MERARLVDLKLERILKFRFSVLGSLFPIRQTRRVAWRA